MKMMLATTTVVLLLSLLAVEHAAADTAGSNSTAQGTNVYVKVLGHSGKIVIGWQPNPQSDPNRVEISMDSIQEVDTNGNPVQTTGQNKHSFTTFANQDFTFSPVQQGVVSNIKAQYFTFNAPLPSVSTNLTLTVYIMSQDGFITLDGETTPVKKDSVKFSIYLGGWSWCSKSIGCSSDGAGVLLSIAVKSKSTIKKQNNTLDVDTYSLGYGTMALSSKVYVDNNYWQEMPSSHPQLQQQGANQLFVFRFPRFTQSVLYDPTVTGDVSQTGGSGHQWSVVTLATVLLATLSSLLLTA